MFWKKNDNIDDIIKKGCDLLYWQSKCNSRLERQLALLTNFENEIDTILGEQDSNAWLWGERGIATESQRSRPTLHRPKTGDWHERSESPPARC